MLNASYPNFTQENLYSFSRVQESRKLSYSGHYKNNCVNQFLTPGLFRQFLSSTFRKGTPREINVSKAKRTRNYFTFQLYENAFPAGLKFMRRKIRRMIWSLKSFLSWEFPGKLCYSVHMKIIKMCVFGYIWMQRALSTVHV